MGGTPRSSIFMGLFMIVYYKPFILGISAFRATPATGGFRTDSQIHRNSRLENPAFFLKKESHI